MILRHVILTVLSESDASGYDIAKEFSNGLGYFWSASHQLVYRELIKLHDMNLVTFEVEPHKHKPDRKVYSITDMGREALLEWFQKPTSHSAIRDELSAKLMVCDIHSSEPMQQHMKAECKESNGLLDFYQGLEHNNVIRNLGFDRQLRLERLMLRRVILNLQARIKWAEEVEAELKDLDSLINAAS